MSSTPVTGTAASVAATARIVPLVLGGFGSQALLVVLGPTIVPVAVDLDTTAGAVGQARSVTAAVALVAALALLGRIESVGVARLLRTGAVSAVLGCGATAAATSMGWFLSAHLLVGLAVGILISASFAGVSAYPVERRPWAMGHVAAAHGLAWVVVNPLVGVIADHLSWRVAQAVPALVAAAVVVAASRAGAVPVATGPPPRLAAVLRTAPARQWLVAETIAYSAWTGILTFVGAVLVVRTDVSVELVGWMLATGAAVYVLASRVSHRVASPTPRSVGLATLAMALAAPALMTSTHPLAGVLAFSAVALAAGVRTPVSGTLGMLQLPSHPAAMMAARTAAMQVGYLLGAVVGGAVIVGLGYPALGLVLSLVLVVSTALVLRVPAEPPRIQQTPTARSTS